MQPESSRRVAPGFVDGPSQEPSTQPLADEVGHQAELDQLDLVRLAAIELGEAGGRAIDMQDVQLIPWVTDGGGKCLIRHLSATKPMEVLAHGVVERSIIRHGR